jgi:hypothetical protein
MRANEEGIAMAKPWLIAIVPGMLMLFVVILIAVLFLLKILWAWTIPDLFPGAVRQGLIAGTISWLTAFKVAIFLAAFGGLAGGRHSGGS